MKVLYLGIAHNPDPCQEHSKAIELASERYLEGFNYFTKGTVSNFLSWFSRETAAKTSPGMKQALTAEDKSITYVIHAQGRPEEVCGIVITDEEYPALVAQRLIEKALSLFVARYPHSTIKTAQPNSLPLPELKELLAQYQNPGEADSILKIQKELDDTTQILHKAYEQVVGRGEKIDSLVAKSETLSAQSKMFYTQAKKQNSCCVVM